MDDHRSVDVKGRTIVPNDFTFSLSPQDHATFTEIHEALVRELCDAAREYARDEGYTFMGPVQVELTLDEELRPGRFTVVSRLHEGQGGVGAGTLILPAGERIPLSEKPVLIGRLPGLRDHPGRPQREPPSRRGPAVRHRLPRRRPRVPPTARG